MYTLAADFEVTFDTVELKKKQKEQMKHFIFRTTTCHGC